MAFVVGLCKHRQPGLRLGLTLFEVVIGAVVGSDSSLRALRFAEVMSPNRPSVISRQQRGGVAANTELRMRLQQMCDSSAPAKKLLIAPKQYCTDNAVMVASLAYYKFKAKLFADLTLEPKATG